MKGLRTSLPLKVVAAVLVAASLGLAIVSGIGLVMLLEVDYRQEDLTYYDTHWCESWATYYAYDVINWYEGGARQQEMDGWFNESDTNFAFQLLGESGTVLLQNYAPQQAGAQGELVTNGYTLRWQVKAPITARDQFYNSYMVFNTVYPLRRSLPVVFALAVLVFLCGVIYLFAAAGHRKGAEGVTLNLADKIPLDLYGAGAALCAAFLASVGLEFPSPGGLLDFVLCLLFLDAAFLLALAFLLSLATRIKAGGWWRSAVTWRLGSWLLGLLRRIWKGFWGIVAGLIRGLPLIWKAAAGFAGVTLLNVFLCAVMFSSHTPGIGFFFFFLLNCALFCAFCYLAMNLQRLQRAGRRLAAGELDYKVDLKMMFSDLKEHGENLNSIAQGMSAAVDQRMRSERLKTELITNVSHDIKTPLTSIINYVDLLRQENLEGKSAQYLEVLDRQAKRLKKLTEDLVEASKASTGNLQVTLERTGVGEILRQALGEYTERLAAGNLEAVVSAPDSELYVLADGRLLWRVMDNLLSNACKYSLGGTRLYIDIARRENGVAISVKNISRDPLNINAEELMERFVRGDTARSTEGSGLGLNIARSLVELMQGHFALAVDGDLFKAEITLQEAQ